MAGARNSERVLFLTTGKSREELEQIANSHGWSLEVVAVHHSAREEHFLKKQSDVSPICSIPKLSAVNGKPAEDGKLPITLPGGSSPL